MSRRPRTGQRPSPHGKGGHREVGRATGPEGRRSAPARPTGPNVVPDAPRGDILAPMRAEQPRPLGDTAPLRTADEPVGALPRDRESPATGDTGDRRPASSTSCTAAQLRRFIKSRAYVPMHELRRRFGINGQDDDVTPVPLDNGTIYVGLPRTEGMLLGELLRGGEVGFELSLDPRTPIVVGVYPMRPVPRP